MHIGIDTVALKGAGFTPRVKVGDKVEAGAPLIDFDLDQVATHAKSLLTQIIILNGDAVRVVERASGYVKAGTDTLLKLTLVNGAAERAREAKATTVTSEAILVPNRHRPARAPCGGAGEHREELPERSEAADWAIASPMRVA